MGINLDKLNGSQSYLYLSLSEVAGSKTDDLNRSFYPWELAKEVYNRL